MRRLYVLKAVPERLKKLTELVQRFLTLQTKPNSEKKLAIYYFKGPGQETLAAQGIEVVPSLYNLLLRLKAEGYNLTGLPADVKAFEAQLMREGPVIQSIAGGQMEEYLKTGNPAWVDKADFDKWIAEDLTPLQIKELEETYGPYARELHEPVPLRLVHHSLLLRASSTAMSSCSLSL